MSKARTLANLISDNAELADGQISVAEVVGAAPTASPTFTGNIDAGDNVKIRLGDGDDLQIYHTGSTSYISDVGDGDLLIQGSNAVRLTNTSGSNYFQGTDGAQVQLYYGGATKLTTTSTGVDVTGTATFSSSVSTPTLASPDGTTIITLPNTGIASFPRGAVFNDSSIDSDFRVESNNNTHMLFVDGGTNGVGINGTPYINFAASSFGHLVFGNSYSTDGGGDIKNSGISWPSAANGNQVISSLINASQDGNYGAIIQFHTRGSGGGNLIERMRIDESVITINDQSRDQDFRVESNNNTHALFVEAGANRVGINNNNPNSQLDISGASVPRVTLTSTSGPYGYMEVNTVGSVGFGADPNGSGGGTNMAFNVDNVETARFYSDLNVFNEGSGNIDFRVESDSQSQAFFVDAGANHARFGPQPSYSGANANCGVLMESIGGNGQTIITANKTNTNFNIAKVNGYTNGSYISFYVAGASVGSISTTGTGTTYSTTSDRRLKDNIEPIADATDKLMAMKPVTHTWIANPEAPSVHGFIAQEMQEIVPEAVSGEDGGEEMMSMDYGRITPVLVAALQEATNEIKALKQRVSELEAI